MESEHAKETEHVDAGDPTRVRREDLVTLRRLTYAVMLHRGISKIKAVQAVEDITTADTHGIDLYAIHDSAVTKIEGEDRWDVGVNFWNEQGMNMFGAPPAPEYWIENERTENPSIDGVGVERSIAANMAGFSSVEDLESYVEKGISEMRKDQLLAAYAAIDYLTDDMWESSAPLYDTGLMGIAIEVQKEYWHDRFATPKQEVIVREIRAKYDLSEAEAKAVERVACPIDRSK